MKKINRIIIASLALNSMIGACEFTITNDKEACYEKIYISMNEKLADIATEQTLQNSIATEKNDEGKEITKKDFAIKQGEKGKTPFTKWFDVYVPLKRQGTYQRLYRVKMKYCADDNAMAVSQIQAQKINMKRFTIKDYSSNASDLLHECHAPGFEHQAEYEKKQTIPQLSSPGVQQIKALTDPFDGKTLLP